MTKQKYSAYALLTAAVLTIGIFLSGFFTQAHAETISYAQMNSASVIDEDKAQSVTNSACFFKFVPTETAIYEVAVAGNTSNDPGMVTLFDVNQWPINWVDETTDCDRINTSAGFSAFLIKDYTYYLKGNAYNDEPFSLTISKKTGFAAFVSSSQKWDMATESETSLSTPGMEGIISYCTTLKLTPSATMKGTITISRQMKQIMPLLLDASGNALIIGAQNTHDSTISGTFKGGSTYYLIPCTMSAYEEDITFSFKGTKVVSANPLSVKARTASISYKKLKKKAQTLDITKLVTFKKKGQGDMKYSLVSVKKGSKSFKKYFKINTKTGKVTVKKKLKKGTYKVKIKLKAAGNSSYKASAWKIVTCTVKVK